MKDRVVNALCCAFCFVVVAAIVAWAVNQAPKEPKTPCATFGRHVECGRRLGTP